jgi:hypothetical protein
MAESARPYIVTAVAVIVGAMIFMSPKDNSTNTSSAKQTAANPCVSDWAKCADNSDMANHNSSWSSAQVACKDEAADRAKYGTPEWPWFAFSSFYPGTNYSTTGIATLIEPDAKFQNGFGAMARSRVICQYDLRTKKVISVAISGR